MRRNKSVINLVISRSRGNTSGEVAAEDIKRFLIIIERTIEEARRRETRQSRTKGGKSSRASAEFPRVSFGRGKEKKVA